MDINAPEVVEGFRCDSMIAGSTHTALHHVTLSRCSIFCVFVLFAVSGIATVAVRSLLASGSELFVGATNGVVGVYSAERGAFLRRFIYHTGDVRALLEIPLPAMPCVCAEVQVADIMNMGSMSSIMDTPLKEPPLSSLKGAGGGMSLHRLHPQELLKPLILSIGNGHLEMSFADCMAGPNEQLVSSLGGSPKLVARGGQAPIYLQCWCR